VAHLPDLSKLSEKDKWDLRCRVLIVLVSMLLIAGLAAFALYKGHDGVMLSTVVGVIGSIALTFLGLKVSDLVKTLRGK
jgi:uncharacterized membrane protein YeaQ/YmgE (transglycosylase-associated protein family)